MIRTPGAHLGLMNGRPGRLPEWPIFLVVFKLRRWSWEVETGNRGLLCHLPFPPPPVVARSPTSRDSFGLWFVSLISVHNV